MGSKIELLEATNENSPISKYIKKKGQKKKLKIKVLYDGPIEAPIEKDQIIAKLNISYDQDLIGEYELLAMNNIKRVNIFSISTKDCFICQYTKPIKFRGIDS